MSSTFPSKGIAKKFKFAIGADDTPLSSPITVPATKFGAIYRLWVSLDAGDDTDLTNLVATATISVTIGSTVFAHEIHPYISHVDAQVVVVEHRTVDLGPWSFDFGEDGLYSGVPGDDIVVGVDALGTGIKALVNYLYTGD